MKHPPKFWIAPLALAGLFLAVMVCLAARFNPFACAWELVMELARALGGNP